MRIKSWSTKMFKFALLLCMTLLLTNGSSAQVADPAELLGEAIRAGLRGDSARELELIETLINEHLGTDQRAAALFMKANRQYSIGGSDADALVARQTFEMIQSDDPDSLHSRLAEVYAADLSLMTREVSRSEYIEAVSAVAVSSGGPSLSNLDPSESWGAAGGDLTSAEQFALLEQIYSTIVWVIVQMEEPERAAFLDSGQRLARYNRIKFPDSRDVPLQILSIAVAAGEEEYTVDPPEDTIPPRVSLISGTTSTQDQELVFSINDGEAFESQVALSTLNIEFDGNPIVPDGITSARGTSPNLEELVVRFSPATTWPIGLNIVTVSVSDWAGNRTDATFEVLVRANEPQEASLVATKDSIVWAQENHRNDGANPLLMLSHRPDIRNKSKNPIVGFDLTNTNLNGLTSAKLVLNIKECDIPKRWGKNGRFIITQPINQP